MSDYQDIRHSLEAYTPDIEASASARSSLSILLHPARLSAAIVSRFDIFDPVTRAFLEGMGSSAGPGGKAGSGDPAGGESGAPLVEYLQEKVRTTRVYEGVDKAIVGRAFTEIMGFYNEEIDMIGVGDGIYSFGILDRDEGGVRKLSTAELLGHEFIHSIQASAFGDAASFLCAYRDTGEYHNEFELVAYSFGGKTPEVFEGKLRAVPRVFRDNTALGSKWWRLER